MKAKKLFKHVLPLALSAVLLFSALPVTAYANDESTDEVTAKIVREAVELREESVKHFLCEDGSYLAVSYAEPVHYEKNGEWLEIDNTLVLSTENTYVPKSNDLAVSFPQSFSGGGKINVESKGHTVSFSVASDNANVTLTKSAAVKAVDSLPSVKAAQSITSTAEVKSTAVTKKSDEKSEAEAHNSELTAVDNQTGALVFNGIFSDADLEYIVTGNSIKENIVVNSEQSEYVYRFNTDFGGLTPIAEEDGSYRLADSTKPDETVFVLAAPYMYDAGGEESYEVAMSLTPSGDGYLLTLTADAEWINSSERTFPVVIDPTLYLDFTDVYVINGISASSPRVNTELRVGRNLTNLARTYIKPQVPTVPEGSVISSATLTLIKDDYYQASSAEDILIYAYDCYGMASWSTDSVSWNNQPFDNSDNGYTDSGALHIATSFATANSQSYEFNITDAAKRWVQTGVCDGIMLASSDEDTKTQVDFYSSRALTASNRPTMTVVYEPASVSDSTWSTDKAAATSPEITVTADGDWTVAVSDPWISVSNSSGTGSSEFTISVTENTSAYQREGTVTVTTGSTVIGVIAVTQYGTEPYLNISQPLITFDYKASSDNFVAVETNAEWDFEYDISNNDWLTVTKSSSGDGLSISVTLNAEIDPDGTEETLSERGVYEVRTAEITVLTDTGNQEAITLRQLNEPLSYFNTINADGSLTLNSSSEYNHALATWAMELSYAAYNPVEYEAIPGIPSSFRHPPFDNDEWTAKAELESKGFEANEYNCSGCLSLVSHSIGYRSIKIEENSSIDSNNLLGGDDSVGYNLVNHPGTGVSTMDVRSGTDSVSSISSISVDSEDIRNVSILSSEESTNESDNNRQLVVIAIRGSVTLWDWLMDFLTQLHVGFFDFDVGAKMVIESLYGYSGCTECDGDDDKCPCKGYLTNNGINNPIILITGHSMGAAIANLVAAELNEREGQEDVYAYTFATPTVKSNVTGDATTPYTNIFNILNSNDVVTYVPNSWLIPNINLWSRHGIDIPLDMPYSETEQTDSLGIFCHSMEVYMNWMRNNQGITYSELLSKSANSRVRGLLPLIAKFKCPVGVAVKDSDGNIIAYESQQEGITYPEITDTGIISWIDDDGAKVFFIPHYADAAKIEIDAYGYGNMTMSMGLLGAEEDDEVADSIAYNNVNLFPGRTFDVDLTEITDEVSMDDISLTEVEVNADGTRTEVGEITDLNPLLRSVTLDSTNVTYGTTTTITVVTDKSVSKVRLIDRATGGTITLDSSSALVTSIVEDGDDLIWTIQSVFVRGTLVYDVAVKVGSTWYTTENVFEITVT